MTPDEQFRDAMRSAIAFRSANRSLFDEINKSLSLVTKLRLGEILPTITKDFAHISSLQAEMAKIRPIIDSPLFEFSKQASLSISQGLSQQIREIAKLTPRISDILRAEVQSLGPAIAAMNELALQSHLAKVSEISLLAQRSLVGLELKEIAKAINVADSVRQSFREAHLGFAQEYSGLFRSLVDDKAKISSILADLSYLPSVEFYRSARVVRTSTVAEEELSAEEDQIFGNINTETTDIVEIILARINPDLIKLWRGASEALESTNPDSVRHFITSLRELLTQVMHAMAPDDQVRAWSKAPEHYHENRPTRRARLLYVCREINHKPFNTFLEKDIDSVLSSFEMFQQGTHQIEAPFSKPQLRALKLRAESTIRFLIDLSKRTSGV